MADVMRSFLGMNVPSSSPGTHLMLLAAQKVADGACRRAIEAAKAVNGGKVRVCADGQYHTRGNNSKLGNASMCDVHPASKMEGPSVLYNSVAGRLTTESEQALGVPKFPGAAGAMEGQTIRAMLDDSKDDGLETELFITDGDTGMGALFDASKQSGQHLLDPGHYMQTQRDQIKDDHACATM